MFFFFFSFFTCTSRNVLLTLDKSQAKLADFGFVKMGQPLEDGIDGSVFSDAGPGTLAWKAPEALEGRTTRASDKYRCDGKGRGGGVSVYFCWYSLLHNGYLIIFHTKT